jgi:hypothetical protein
MYDRFDVNLNIHNRLLYFDPTHTSLPSPLIPSPMLLRTHMTPLQHPRKPFRTLVQGISEKRSAFRTW